MWATEDEDDDDAERETDEMDGGELSKRELVDGLVAAVST
jgi:hypothetical protein